MERLDRDVSSIQAPLEKAPKVLDSLGVNFAANVLIEVVNGLMDEFLFSQSRIGPGTVGVDLGARDNLIQNLLLENVAAGEGDHLGANLAGVAVQHPHDDGLAIGKASVLNPPPFRKVHVGLLPADVGFIHFNGTVAAADPQDAIRLEGQSDAVQHEPGRLLADLDRPRDLVAAHPVLAVCDHPHRCEPLAQWDRRILHDGSDFDGEFALGVMAGTLPGPALGVEADTFRTASWANNLAIRPAALGKVADAVVELVEVDDSLLKGKRFAFHIHHLKQTYPNYMGESS